MKKKKKNRGMSKYIYFLKNCFLIFKIFLREVGLYKGFSGIALDNLELVARDKPRSHEKKYSGNGATSFVFVPFLS